MSIYNTDKLNEAHRESYIIHTKFIILELCLTFKTF